MMFNLNKAINLGFWPPLGTIVVTILCFVRGDNILLAPSGRVITGPPSRMSRGYSDNNQGGQCRAFRHFSLVDKLSCSKSKTTVLEVRQKFLVG